MPHGRVLMVQGTASSVGKSVLVAALCRIFRQDGYRVAPFKAQNMSNNSFIAADGGEIARSQAVQAEAAGLDPIVDMNPIILKPEADHRSQVIVRGRVYATMTAREYFQAKPSLLPVVADSLNRLRTAFDVVVIEGAGSPAEINLRESDIVNMRVARLARAPVVLVGDIDRGGVFASLVGTMELLEGEERQLVRGLVINKFRGDASLLQPGLDFLARRTGVPVLGVVPHVDDLGLPEEDAATLEERARPAGGGLRIAVVRLPHISNFDDFQPLEEEPGVAVEYVTRPEQIVGAHLVVLPGTKSTVADLAWLRNRGLAEAIQRHAANGGAIVGICGGYQMLGEEILDPLRVESAEERAEGLGLLPVRTVFDREKATCRVRGTLVGGAGLVQRAEGAAVEGYEIHMGRTERAALGPAVQIVERDGRPTQHGDGAVSEDGRILGTYVHGLFQHHEARRAILRGLAESVSAPWRPSSAGIDDAQRRAQAYDRLAAVVRASLDMPRLYEIVGLPSR
ncbi:MAG TPA: cobyric acid synthase [Chloroflexota bacterium]